MPGRCGYLEEKNYMSVRKIITEPDGVFFITFTCYQWLHLLAEVDGYDIAYKQFDILKKDGHYILGYVIMPNHIHVIIAFTGSGKSINARVGAMKRFMAYEIIGRLKQAQKKDILEILTAGVSTIDRKKGKLHRVFEPSFDSKHCRSLAFIRQKLDYIHHNPCRGKWQLAESPSQYLHSSAGYYLTDSHADYPVTNYMEMQDIDLTTL
jgi:REP element-mobilizing transposase RayT